MKKLTLAIFLHLLLVPVFSQKSSLRIFQKTFKTYMYSDPDPVPHPQSNIYPYFRFDGYTDEPVDKDWTIVELENEWIKVHITPEIGGKIWGAWEKSTGFPFIYANDVVKFRDVAMRGAWTSGGIEFNFGDIGHAPTVATPVDWTTRENADGSVSCFVGALDLSSRTRWMVEINLPADKAYFTTRSRWYNCTPFETSYYHWMNGGFRAEGDLEFCFPGTNYIGHEGELHTWPIDEKGRDLSFYKNNDFGSYKSYHVLGEPTDWFGGYWHDDDMGVVHYSPYADKLGKKIWIWGLSRQGYIWENLLTDKSGQYVELQSGRLFNQASPGSINSPFKHVAFKPYTTDEWTEYWYPVKGTGGISYADERGALNLAAQDDSVRISFVALQEMTEEIEISQGMETVFKMNLKLRPMEVFEKKLKVDPKNLTIKIGNRVVPIGGAKEPPSKRPLTSSEAFDWGSGYGKFLKGKDLMNQRRYAEAMDELRSCLEQEPNTEAMSAAAEILIRQGEFGGAISVCQAALAINTYDPAANFLTALANENLAEHPLKNSAGASRTFFIYALDGYSVAALSPTYRSAAYLRMAVLHLRENDLDKALQCIENSLAADPTNLHGLAVKSAILRLQNKYAAATVLLEKSLSEDPLNQIALFEKYLISREANDRRNFKESIRNELAFESYIETAAWYYDLRQYETALQALDIAPPHPKVDIWRALIFYKKGDDETAFEWAEKVAKSPVDFVFPFRWLELPFFKDLPTQVSNNWRIHYYSVILGSKITDGDVKLEFEKLGNTPDYPPFYLAKADLFKDEPTVVLASLERAWALAPGDWRTATRLANFHLENGNPAKALEYAEAGQKAHPKHSPMGLVYAKTLNANGLYEKTAAFLKTYKVLPAEGAYAAHDIWREANLHVALAKMTAKKWKDAFPWLDAAMALPENLGSGKPYFPDERLPMWMKAHCLKQLKKQGEAGVAKDYLFSYSNPDEAPGYLGEFLTALALRDAGKSMEAQQRLAAAPVGNTPAALQEWCKQVVQGQNPPPSSEGLSRDWKVAMGFLNLTPSPSPARRGE
jgi:tetratricopeptide (TPR) repeat protein